MKRAPGITFKRLYVEITNVCNLDCSFCPKTSRPPMFMEIEQFKKILDEVKEYSKYLYFHVMGEPLMHPELGTFLDLCDENDFKVNIVTNGTLIEEEKDKLLSKPALRAISFSLHIFDKTTSIQKVDKYLDDIFEFITEAQKRHTFFACLRLWNLNNKDTYYSYVLERIEKYFDYPHKIEDIPYNGNDIKIRENIYVSQNLLFDWPNKDIPDINEDGFCLGLRKQAGILVDGTVVPCCLDSEGTIDLGNINVSSFKEIIEGKRAENIYNGFSDRKAVESLCRKCGYRQRFSLKCP
ncbi:MAG: radical SAM protein [Candidatus Omnitrophica bacterium]|nr:radical SAM protein [Candidatus Omnitrophota bacterium]